MKKISMFFTKAVQDLMPTDAAHGTLPGILNAIDFPNKLLNTVFGGYLVTKEDAKKLGGENGWKFFTADHDEGRDTKNAVYRAARIESCIFTERKKGPIGLHVSFFEKKVKEPFFVLWISFGKISGNIVATDGISKKV